jgi:hypothetical protein
MLIRIEFIHFKISMLKHRMEEREKFTKLCGFFFENLNFTIQQRSSMMITNEKNNNKKKPKYKIQKYIRKYR